MAPEPISGAEYIDNRWLGAGCVLEQPEGTSYEIEWGSSDYNPDGLGALTIEPEVWHPTSETVPERRFLHIRVTMYSDETNRLTPVMRSGYPYLDYGSFWNGFEHMPKLLRADGTEFPGGAFLTDLMFPEPWAEYDSRAPQGRMIHHKRQDPIDIYDGFGVRVTSEAAMREIRETCMEEDFMIEGYGRRSRIHFHIEEQLKFKFVDTKPTIFHPTSGPHAGEFYALMEATGASADVYEHAPLPDLVR
jgi:hypothetical protein